MYGSHKARTRIIFQMTSDTRCHIICKDFMSTIISVLLFIPILCNQLKQHEKSNGLRGWVIYFLGFDKKKPFECPGGSEACLHPSGREILIPAALACEVSCLASQGVDLVLTLESALNPQPPLNTKDTPTLLVETCPYHPNPNLYTCQLVFICAVFLMKGMYQILI